MPIPGSSRIEPTIGNCVYRANNFMKTVLSVFKLACNLALSVLFGSSLSGCFPDNNHHHAQQSGKDATEQTAAPVANDAKFSTLFNHQLTGQLTGTDPKGLPLTFSLVRASTHGELTINAQDGRFEYLPKTPAPDTDSFSFKVDNGSRVSAPAEVNIEIVSGQLLAADDSYQGVLEGGVLNVPISLGLLFNDQNTTSQTMTVILIDAPAHAQTMVLNKNGSFIYTHDGSENFSDSFHYRITNGTLESNTATVTINITPVNDPPVALDDNGEMLEGGSVAIHITANDFDAEGALDLTSIALTNVENGSASVDPHTGVVQFVHDGSETRVAGFNYTVADTAGAVAPAAKVSLQVTPVNDPPQARADALKIDRLHLETAIPVLANDSDPDSRSLTISSVQTDGLHGQARIDSAGTMILYTPESDFQGDDIFSYTIGDQAGGSATSTVTVTVTPATPNIIVVLADDLGYGDLGIYGSSTISTPNLDRMATEGARFTDFYAAPVCGPYRAALLTGTYAPRITMSFNHMPGAGTGINPGEVTIAQMLKERNYVTGMLGKWHLSEHPEFMPTRKGFDMFYGIPYSNDMWPFHPLTCAQPFEDPRLAAARARAALTGYDGQGGKTCWPTGTFPDLPVFENETVVDINPDQSKFMDEFVRRAKDFMQTRGDQPFFLYAAFPQPHVPLFPAARFIGTSTQGLYGDAVQEIDWGVGEILQYLDTLGIDENTLVIFTSDNGPWAEYGIDAGTTGGLRGSKKSNWEGGVRVPMIARWPGHIPQGSTVTEIASHIDILPTIAALVKAPPITRKLDGLDIWPLLAGQVNAESPHDYIYYYNQSQSWQLDQTLMLQAIRGGKWKLHLIVAATGVITAKALYDLARDRSEQTDLLASRPDVANQLLAQAVSFNDSMRQEKRLLGQAVTQVGGLLSVTTTQAPPNVNLTGEGTLDWWHWGLNSAASVNRFQGKTGGPVLGYTQGISPQQFTDNSGLRSTFSWTNGDPVASVNNSATGLKVSQLNGGFILKIPADTQTHTLKLYLGAEQARGKLVASISDNSAPPRTSFTDSSQKPRDNVLTINYHAAGAGQEMTLVYTLENSETGSISLRALALQ